MPPVFMPEALALLAVFAVAVASYVGAWLHARDPANYKPDEERIRLLQQQRHLEQRLQTAQRENWGREMEAPISRELATVARQLSDAAASRGT